MGTHTVAGKFNPQKYVNLIISVAGALTSAIFALGTTNGHLTAVEIVNLAIAGVAAFQVWYVTETADNPKGKAVIAFISAALIAGQSVIATHVHLQIGEWLQILVAGLTATGLLGTNTTAVLRRALSSSYANNTYVVNAGTPQASTEVRPVPPVVPTVVAPVTPLVPAADPATIAQPVPPLVVNDVPPMPLIGGVPADGSKS